MLIAISLLAMKQGTRLKQDSCSHLCIFLHMLYPAVNANSHLLMVTLSKAFLSVVQWQAFLIPAGLLRTCSITSLAVLLHRWGSTSKDQTVQHSVFIFTLTDNKKKYVSRKNKGGRGQETQRGKIFLYISINKLQSWKLLTTSRLIQCDSSCILR